MARRASSPDRRDCSVVTINGRVDTGADSTPVGGAAIEVIGTSGPGERRTITDAAGRFEMEAVPGALHLEVTAKGFLTQRVDLTVVAGMSAIEIVLPRAGSQRERRPATRKRPSS